MAKRRKKRSNKSPLRLRVSWKAGLLITVFLIIWGTAGEWYVHHPRAWLMQQHEAWPSIVTKPLCWIGNPLSDITDGLGLTGHDAVYEYDTDPPSGSITFAGIPQRIGNPAPNDITVIDRGEFKIGWSNKLRHPVWCAYHVTREQLYDAGKRPGFTMDRALAAAPRPDDYKHSGYDRGHMVPNYAIITRYGAEIQKQTFKMSNIAPQSPALNRGVWRDVEHRIADLWTAKYGEIWVVVGCISPITSKSKLGNTDIDVPTHFYQVVIAQEKLDVRAFAVIFSQKVPWDAWAARHLISIDELEELTGLDFNPELPSFIQDPLESDLPSRLWPICGWDILKQISLRFH